MKKIILAALMAAATAGAIAQINIPLGQSGYYGRIDLGNLGAPPVIYQEPMLVERPYNYRPVAPTYLRVPPGHAKKWRKHCAAYDACGRPVYFVQDSWYNNTYAPQYRRIHGDRDGRDYNQDHDRSDHRDYDRERAKDYREERKEHQKDRREFFKEQEKHHKEYEKDRKDYDKDRRKAEKEYYKDRKKHDKHDKDD